MLLQAKRVGLLNQLPSLIEALRAHGFRLDDDLVGRILATTQEDSGAGD